MILVTGGAGFIGSVLIRELNNEGREDIIVVDRLRDAQKWLNIRKLKYDDYIHADELFLEEYSGLWDDVSFIYHIGACSSTTENNVDYLMSNNVNYSKVLISLAQQKDIPIVYASSAATYGDGELGYDDDHDKTPNYLPLNPYGYSKQLVDCWLLKQENKPKHWFGVKFFNVFGPNEYHKGSMRSLVVKAHEQINKHGKVQLFKSHKDGFKDGEQLRDFIYVKDIARILIQMMNPSSAAFSGIYNLGTGQERSFKDLVNATFAAMNLEPNIEYIDMPESLRDQYQYFTKANMKKFKNFLPNFTFTSLEDSVSDYVNQHLQQKDNYY